MLPEKLSRYAAVATLFLKYNRKSPEELARDLEALGPTFVKLGQVLSSRPDLLPRPYLDALARLQDDVAPFSYAEAKSIIEAELGVRMSKAFSSFDETPVAAASLGQVHRAALRDGTVVAVKVQRPGVAEHVAADLDALDQVAVLLEKHSEAGRQYDIVGMVKEFRDAITAEMDYRREAANLVMIGESLAEFELIVVPRPISGYTSTRVLTMDYVHGTKVTALSPVVRLDLDGVVLAETLVRAYLKQIVVDGVFHADPHPGNVFVTHEGRLALIDLGMIGRLTPTMQEQLLKLLLAISEGRGEEAADITIVLGEKLADFNEPAFKREIATLVGRYGHESLAEFQVGAAFIELNDVARTHHMRPPAELTLLGKTLLHLDHVARALQPDLDVNDAIRRNGADLMRRRVRKAVASGSVFAAVLEAKEFAEKLPGRVNRVLDSLAASELKMKVEMIDEGSVIDGLQKVANRITLGLILASMIVGAAMMMRIDTAFRILGYPGVAMILFLLAATGAGYLAVQILLHDRTPKRR